MRIRQGDGELEDFGTLGVRRSPVLNLGTASIPFNHLDRMTDSTGLIQHGVYGIPRRESGYTTDDNARALRLCVRLWQRLPHPDLLARITTYLSFLEHACVPRRGFRNFLSYQRGWLDAADGEDCHGQAVLALAETAASRIPLGCSTLARELIASVLPKLAELRSLRAQAYVILAWERLDHEDSTGLESLGETAVHAADRLMDCYQRSDRRDWHWFESTMTYANAVLPHALLAAAACWPGDAYREVGEDSLRFLDASTTIDGVFWPVGNNDWYPHGEAKAAYDQQPVEASTTVDAALAAFDLTGNPAYWACARRAHRWFHGANSLGVPLADLESGGCCDGLQSDRVNENQGAESTLAWLWTELRFGGPGSAVIADFHYATGD